MLPIVLDTRAPIEMPLPSGALSSQLLRSLLEERGIFPASARQRAVELATQLANQLAENRKGQTLKRMNSS